MTDISKVNEEDIPEKFKHEPLAKPGISLCVCMDECICMYASVS